MSSFIRKGCLCNFISPFLFNYFWNLKKKKKLLYPSWKLRNDHIIKVGPTPIRKNFNAYHASKKHSFEQVKLVIGELLCKVSPKRYGLTFIKVITYILFFFYVIDLLCYFWLFNDLQRTSAREKHLIDMAFNCFVRVKLKKIVSAYFVQWGSSLLCTFISIVS